jgi:adenosylmethionine-8-amino-7-oxononanoate aminotransferase
MKESVDMKKCTDYFHKNNIWLRPFGKLIYTMPPYIISDKELNILTDGIVHSINEIY